MHRLIEWHSDRIMTAGSVIWRFRRRRLRNALGYHIEDYDCDGELGDFQRICAWGTGGFWHSLFSSDGNKFRFVGQEPEGLALMNKAFQMAKSAANILRSDLEYHATYTRSKRAFQQGPCDADQDRNGFHCPSSKNSKDDLFIGKLPLLRYGKTDIQKRTVEPQYSQ